LTQGTDGWSPVSTQVGHAGRSDWVNDLARPPSPTAASRRRRAGRRYGAEIGGGKGPSGPYAHPGDAGEVSLVREGPVASNLVAAELGSDEENGDGGGDSGHGGSIPSVGRERAARWSWGRARRRSGRRLAAAGGDVQGG
jgi:hypothetical protein